MCMAKSETDYIVCDHREVKRFSDTCEKKKPSLLVRKIWIFIWEVFWVQPYSISIPIENMEGCKLSSWHQCSVFSVMLSVTVNILLEDPLNWNITNSMARPHDLMLIARDVYAACLF